MEVGQVVRDGEGEVVGELLGLELWREVREEDKVGEGEGQGLVV